MYKGISRELPQKMGGSGNIKRADAIAASALLLGQVKRLAEKYLRSQFHPQGQRLG